MRLLHVIVYVIVLIILVGAAVSYIDANNASGAPAERIQEDSPGWNCQTMGNKVCGLRESNERFRHYDEAFNCFAEVTYTEPGLPWNVRVERCIPQVAPN